MLLLSGNVFIRAHQVVVQTLLQNTPDKKPVLLTNAVAKKIAKNLVLH
jgi:hypothetical protein